MWSWTESHYYCRIGINATETYRSILSLNTQIKHHIRIESDANIDIRLYDRTNCRVVREHKVNIANDALSIIDFAAPAMLGEIQMRSSKNASIAIYAT